MNRGWNRWIVVGMLSLLSGCDKSSPQTLTRESAKALPSTSPETPPNKSGDCTETSRNGHTYRFCKRRATFAEARSRCKAVKLDLAIVDDKDENALLAANVGENAYIGLSDSQTEPAWKWVADGSLNWCGDSGGGRIAGYANWAPQQPPASKSDAHPIPPKPFDCALLSSKDGKWRASDCSAPAAFVCETAPPHAGAKLGELTTYIRDQYIGGRPAVGSYAFKPTAFVTDPVSAYYDRLGLRTCVDTLHLSSRPPEPGKSRTTVGLESIRFDQYYLGVPVNNRGYTAWRDPKTKRVDSVLGQVEHNLGVDTEPTVDTDAARLVAVKAIPNAKLTDYSPKPAGRLNVFEVYPDNWQLGWTFEFPDRNDRPGYLVVVSAHDAKVLYVDSSIKQ